jgi:hypothetical protein
MKKSSTKSARPKASGRRTRDDRTADHDRGWHELEAQHDRLKSDWMSLAVQLGIGGAKPEFE